VAAMITTLFIIGEDIVYTVNVSENLINTPLEKRWRVLEVKSIDWDSNVYVGSGPSASFRIVLKRDWRKYDIIVRYRGPYLLEEEIKP
jgi:hypothetical protein